MDLMYRNTLIGHYTKGQLSLVNSTKESLIYFNDSSIVTGNQLNSFIADRVISSSRRDIDKFLNAIGLLTYDIHEIALATRLVNPMDAFWLRENEYETYENLVEPKLLDLFNYNKLTVENTLSSGGQNIKHYAKVNDKFGIIKKRLTGLTYDSESELAVYYLAELMGIKTCPVTRIDSDNTFSEFQYNFLKDSIVHIRHALKDFNKNKNEFVQIVKQYPKTKDDLVKMLILDYITAQDDRHMSNYAIIEDSLYPLYDNGRSLFWEERTSTIKMYVEDVIANSTAFGQFGTYYDILSDLSKEGIKFGKLVNLNIYEKDIKDAYHKAGYTESDRLDLLVKWTSLSLNELRKLDNNFRPSEIFG